MNSRFSVYLDAVRFAAALVVVFSHFAYARFSGGAFAWVRELNLGSDAVAVFFVLSGFVIAHAAAQKDKSLSAFAFSRATRVFSVAIPAVLLTIALDRAGAALAPALYEGWWYNPAPAAEQLLRALTFTNELWFESFRVGANGPYWSLAYEVWYYALFAAAFYLRGGKRIVALAAGALVAGPKILLLAPVWLLGVCAYRVVAAGRTRDAALSPCGRGDRERVIATAASRVRGAGASLAQVGADTPHPSRRCAPRHLLPQGEKDASSPAHSEFAWLLALAPPLLYVAALAGGAPEALRGLTVSLLGEDFVQSGLKFSDEFLWNAIIGALAAAHFVGMAALLREGKGRGGALARWLAGASFSIYLVHYPLMQFAAALLPSPALVLAFTLAGSFAFATLFERPLPALRAWLAGRTKASEGHPSLAPLARRKPPEARAASEGWLGR